MAANRRAELVTGDPELRALEGRIHLHWLE
jgi:hypothetical protein